MISDESKAELLALHQAAPRRTAMMIVNAVLDCTSCSVDERQRINDEADDVVERILRLHTIAK